jgi:small subunit ribosomal protein S20
MANTPQAKKRIRRNARRAEINGARVSRIRTFIKAVESALLAGDKGAAPKRSSRRSRSWRAASRAACIHKNTASRKFSRLTKRVSSLG